jgi:hypothetical protein
MPQITMRSRDFSARLDVADDAKALRFKTTLTDAFREQGGYWLAGTDDDGRGFLHWLPAATSEFNIYLDGDLPPELKADRDAASAGGPVIDRRD